MRDLAQSLQDHDLGFLRAVADLWGLDPPTGELATASAELADQMRQPELLTEVVQALPAEAMTGLARLRDDRGRLPWADFQAAFGGLRQMGPGQRDRTRPWRQPQSATEVLYYRGLIDRAFADTEVGVKEFAYIPSDLLSILPPLAETNELAIEANHTPVQVQSPSTALVDDAVTLLASIRRQPLDPAETQARVHQLQPALVHPQASELLLHLLAEIEVIGGQPLQARPEAIGELLAAPRSHTLAILSQAWLASDRWQDLAMLDDLAPGPSGWPPRPNSLRAAALGQFETLPAGGWIALSQFVQVVRQRHPTFAGATTLAEAGLLRHRQRGPLPPGMAAWEAVEGSLLHWLATGPLFWFGALELGGDSHESVEYFRIPGSIRAFLEGEPMAAPEPPASHGRVHGDGRIALPRSTPLAQRYQIARLAQPVDYQAGTYTYRLRPSDIRIAIDQGLRPEHLHQLLDGVSDQPIPPSLLQAIERLASDGIEARVATASLLRVDRPAALDQLMAGASTKRYLAERLGPTAATIVPGGHDKLLAAAAASGLLVEPQARKRAGE